MAKIMLDSGAFSVWNSGKTIDLDDYITFCGDRPEVDYYVNLDVIPPKGVIHITRAILDGCAEEGYRNYRKMVGLLPSRDQIIPVFHQGEDEKWLGKYLDRGATYIGLGSLAGSGAIADKVKWVRSVAKHLDGVRVHGFGIGGHELASAFPWHSIDSTTWSQHSQVWQFLVPLDRRGESCYTVPPLVVKTSPRAKGRETLGGMSPTVRRMVTNHLDRLGIPGGEFTVIPVPAGYRKQDGEVWLDGKKKQVVRTLTPGVVSESSYRDRVNSHYFVNMAGAYGIKNFYHAGIAHRPDWWTEDRNVLVSFNSPEAVDQWLLR